MSDQNIYSLISESGQSTSKVTLGGKAQLSTHVGDIRTNVQIDHVHINAYDSQQSNSTRCSLNTATGRSSTDVPPDIRSCDSNNSNPSCKNKRQRRFSGREASFADVLFLDCLPIPVSLLSRHLMTDLIYFGRRLLLVGESEVVLPHATCEGGENWHRCECNSGCKGKEHSGDEEIFAPRLLELSLMARLRNLSRGWNCCKRKCCDGIASFLIVGDEGHCTCNHGLAGNRKDCTKTESSPSTSCDSNARCRDGGNNHYQCGCDCNKEYTADGKSGKKSTYRKKRCNENVQPQRVGNITCNRPTKDDGKAGDGQKSRKTNPWESNSYDSNGNCRNVGESRSSCTKCTCQKEYVGSDGKRQWSQMLMDNCIMMMLLLSPAFGL